MNRFIFLFVLLNILVINTFAQEKRKSQQEADFEKFKREREQDFQNFKQKREAELKKMEQDYLDYYNEMTGLKKHYVAAKEPEKAQTVQDIIDYENTIAKTLGYKIPERIKEKPKGETTAENPKQTNEDAKESIEEVKESETPTETLKADADTRDGIPVLTPVHKTLAKITSPFGVRIHPTLGRPIKHNGIDFGSGRGAEVFAASSGKVVLAQYNGTYGNYIIIEHNNGTSSVYAHLERITVTRGNPVKKGEVIGYTGSTGRSSGPHLHYEVRIKGIPVDPKGYLIEVK
ncbi:MAG: M23 family metallopeptidase [Bacteroidota bacterium]